jgi:hypothetical protein
MVEQVLSMPAPRRTSGCLRAAGWAVQRQEDEGELQTNPLAASITPRVQRREEDGEIKTTTPP